MPGQTGYGVRIARYLSHGDYTIVQRECYHRHAKHILPCVKAAGEQDSLKRLKNTVCVQDLSISCPLRLKSKWGSPISQIVYFDVLFSCLQQGRSQHSTLLHKTGSCLCMEQDEYEYEYEQNEIYAKCNANM